VVLLWLSCPLISSKSANNKLLPLRRANSVFNQSNISPPHLKGSIGVINQLSIVIGILSAQALGVSPLGASPNSPSLFERNLGLDQAPWRFVPLISAAFPLIQILLSPLALNPPSDLQGEEKEKVERQLWGSNPDGESEQGEQEALLAEDEADADTQGSDGSSSNTSSSVLSITDLLKVVSRPKSSSNLETSSKEHSEIRKGTLVIIFSQMAQQLSGVNGVFYFSTGILSDVFKGGDSSGAGGDKIARFIGLGITFVNFLMTFPPIYLINESLLGRKRLLQISSASMAISSLALAFALLFGQSILAAVSIVVFVAGFSLGLGPIPFLILPELVPKRVSFLMLPLHYSLVD
jgi:SP family facilitated glucose transporter-like MFS transporter 3